MPNPEWINAPYEIAMVPAFEKLIRLHAPYRYVYENGTFRQVDPFIKVQE